ncbi:hypothetical protein K435DRAFT_672777 [Dendrothele bispora CBS 962.96]|uniref:Uncharacterized protein n=1 Tax=Dendrothele bispora (strain CBS 962.96) TaxID=1314807 RepID=A0A4S8LT24_DENBC|nr:hypothetical protein K435DRAFT_672777 [Dendrothele bispora CBS 962.96]
MYQQTLLLYFSHIFVYILLVSLIVLYLWKACDNHLRQLKGSRLGRFAFHELTSNIDLFNPLDAPLHVLFVQSDAGVNGEIFAHFEHQFDSFVVSPGQTVNSGDLPNVLLTQGTLNSLDIIPLGKIDTFSAVTAQVGDGGYVVPWLQLTQPGVPTTYSLDIAGLDVGLPKLKAMASSVSESSVAATATTKSESALSEAASQGARTTSEGEKLPTWRWARTLCSPTS